MGVRMVYMCKCLYSYFGCVAAAEIFALAHVIVLSDLTPAMRLNSPRLSSCNRNHSSVSIYVAT